MISSTWRTTALTICSDSAEHASPRTAQRCCRAQADSCSQLSLAHTAISAPDAEGLAACYERTTSAVNKNGWIQVTPDNLSNGNCRAAAPSKPLWELYTFEEAAGKFLRGTFSATAAEA